MKKLVNLLKNYLTKSSPAVATPTFKTEQFDKVKKDLLDQKHSGCECKHEAPAKKQVEVKKPAAKNTPKPKPKGK
jgi:hypothetical protein